MSLCLLSLVWLYARPFIQRPFAVGQSTDVISNSLEDETLVPAQQDTGLGIDALALHQNEPSCALRIGNPTK